MCWKVKLDKWIEEKQAASLHPSNNTGASAASTEAFRQKDSLFLINIVMSVTLLLSNWITLTYTSVEYTFPLPYGNPFKANGSTPDQVTTTRVLISMRLISYIEERMRLHVRASKCVVLQQHKFKKSKDFLEIFVRRGSFHKCLASIIIHCE